MKIQYVLEELEVVEALNLVMTELEDGITTQHKRDKNVFAACKKKNSTARITLLSSMVNDIMRELRKHENSKNMWNALKIRFGQTSITKLRQLIIRFDTYKMSHGHNIKQRLKDLIAGGTESSSTTVEWAISELLKRPEIFKKAIEELDRVIGRDRWVCEKDIASLPYIDAIAKEAMRLHPVAPMLAPRMTREDCKIDGYYVPKGTQVLVLVWSIARDPQIWDSPYEFQPERFLGRDIDVKGQSFELMPFGPGRRMCPGCALGLKVVQANLANLLHGFKWKLPGGMRKEDLDMEEIFGLSTPKKIPLVAVAEPRLPDHMYSL